MAVQSALRALSVHLATLNTSSTQITSATKYAHTPATLAKLGVPPLASYLMGAPKMVSIVTQTAVASIVLAAMVCSQESARYAPLQVPPTV